MRTLSAAATRAITAQETGEAFLLLLTIDHPDLTQPIRVARNGEDVVSRGNTYTAYPFEIEIPEERGDRPPRVRLVLDNVDRQITEAIRPLTSSPTVTLEVVLASSPDTVEAGPYDFTIRNITYDAQVITAELAYEDVLNLRFPADRFTPNLFPGLF
ncbi:DUF1833 family protein [Deferrisoma camini]|uniref:DUF1833 family protein n=1 Tax=Deferrisoma camini TaxID=1035120 RepID=UPI00046CF1E4|nr:DUF1833 family protein [Deferrisoma camini]